jgi:hypothetical protein
MSSHNVGCQLFRPYCNIWSHSELRTASNSKHHFGLNSNILATFHSSTYVGLLKIMSYWNVTSCSQMWSNVSEKPSYLSSGYKFIYKTTRCHVTEVRNLCVYRGKKRHIFFKRLSLFHPDHEFCICGGYYSSHFSGGEGHCPLGVGGMWKDWMPSANSASWFRGGGFGTRKTTVQ